MSPVVRDPVAMSVVTWPAPILFDRTWLLPMSGDFTSPLTMSVLNTVFAA